MFPYRIRIRPHSTPNRTLSIPTLSLDTSHNTQHPKTPRADPFPSRTVLLATTRIHKLTINTETYGLCTTLRWIRRLDSTGLVHIHWRCLGSHSLPRRLLRT